MSGISDLGPLVVAAAGAVRDQVVMDQMKEIERLTKENHTLAVLMQKDRVTITGHNHNPVYAVSKPLAAEAAGLTFVTGGRTQFSLAQLSSLQLNIKGETHPFSEWLGTTISHKEGFVFTKYCVRPTPYPCFVTVKYDAAIPNFPTIRRAAFEGFQANPFRLRDDEVPSISIMKVRVFM